MAIVTLGLAQRAPVGRADSVVTAVDIYQIGCIAFIFPLSSNLEENKNKSPDAKPSSCKSNAKKSSNDIARYAKTPDTEQVHTTPLNGEDKESAMLELLRWKLNQQMLSL
jgi:hypothetical protein